MALAATPFTLSPSVLRLYPAFLSLTASFQVWGVQNARVLQDIELARRAESVAAAITAGGAAGDEAHNSTFTLANGDANRTFELERGAQGAVNASAPASGTTTGDTEKEVTFLSLDELAAPVRQAALGSSGQAAAEAPAPSHFENEV